MLNFFSSEGSLSSSFADSFTTSPIFPFRGRKSLTCLKQYNPPKKLFQITGRPITPLCVIGDHKCKLDLLVFSTGHFTEDEKHKEKLGFLPYWL